MLTRPATIMRSAWRGLPRNTSAPKRDTSKRGPAIAIISMAQQARPKPSGQIAFARAQFTTLCTVVNRMPFSSSARRRSSSETGPVGITRPGSGFEGAAWASVRNGAALGAGSVTVVSRSARGSFPLQGPLLQEVEVPDEQDEDEQHHLHQAVEPQLPEGHRPRVEEHGLDVEQDEQHGHDVEPDVEPAARVAE